VSLYGDAAAAIGSVTLIDERVQSVAAKVDRLADEVRDMRERLVRVETIVAVRRNSLADSPVDQLRQRPCAKFNDWRA
jgi:hypothetical protein